MTTEELVSLIVNALEDVKAQDIRVYDTTDKTSAFERVIVASGTSNRQTRALGLSAARAVKENGGKVPADLRTHVEEVSSLGGTPLVVCENNKVLGVIYLKDTVKPGMVERFERLRAIGIKTIMCTGDNPLTAATIAKEAGVDGFVAECKPEDKIALIKKEQAEGKIVAIVADEELQGAITSGTDAILVLDQTPFYAEMGGQMGDAGVLENASTLLAVSETYRIKESVFGHVAHVKEGAVHVGDVFKAEVNAETRAAVARNHSVTHLMHKALREVLGAHVAQKGSLVTDKVTRFDFLHDKPLTAEEIAEVEAIVNKEILANTEVVTRVMSLEEAKTSGAVMLFGEKYGKTVRVVTVGTSAELCGGTHVARTGDIGSFKILGEAGISAGVRRMEAVTGLNAVALMQHQATLLAEAALRFKTPAEELASKIDHLMETAKQLEKEVASYKEKLAAEQGAGAVAKAEDVAGVKVLVTTLDGMDAKSLRTTMDDLKNKLKSAVILLAVAANGKIQFCAGVTKDLVGRVKAGELVNFAAAQAGGKGGGKPDMAMAGAADVSKLDVAMTSAKTWITEKLA